jgi:hypothetical protein
MGGQCAQGHASVVVSGFLAFQRNFQPVVLKALTEYRILLFNAGRTEKVPGFRFTETVLPWEEEILPRAR